MGRVFGRRVARQAEVRRWWGELGADERRALGASGRDSASVVVRFAPPDEAADDGEVNDFYEYLVNHEVYLEDGRAAHICSAHPAARAVLAAGRIPAGFRCPRADASCPMRALLERAPGCEVRLSLVRGPRS
jgi:hypothetical protein